MQKTRVPEISSNIHLGLSENMIFDSISDTMTQGDVDDKPSLAPHSGKPVLPVSRSAGSHDNKPLPDQHEDEAGDDILPMEAKDDVDESEYKDPEEFQQWNVKYIYCPDETKPHAYFEYDETGNLVHRVHLLWEQVGSSKKGVRTWELFSALDPDGPLVTKYLSKYGDRIERMRQVVLTSEAPTETAN